jgi:hypothetical protein
MYLKIILQDGTTQFTFIENDNIDTINAVVNQFEEIAKIHKLAPIAKWEVE